MQKASRTHPGHIDAYNALHPMRPKFALECCNCSNQRQSTAGDFGTLGATPRRSQRFKRARVYGRHDGVGIVDYYSESHGWPKVS